MSETPGRKPIRLTRSASRAKIASPKLVATEVALTNLRDPTVSVNFSDDSAGFVRCPSQISDFGKTGNWKATYDLELNHLLAQQVSA